MTITKITNHKGYEIFLDDKGFFIEGLDGLNQPKKIYRDTFSDLIKWIDERFSAWLGR